MAARRPWIRTTDRAALAALLSSHYPQIYRIAAAVSGSQESAQKISHQVLARSLAAVCRLESPADADRWFPRDTILVTRAAHPSPLESFVADPLFATLLAALHELPIQQREAFFLHHGEGFALWQMGTAMDCSTEAASNHLVSATRRLRPLAEDRLLEFTSALPAILASLTPPPQTISLAVGKPVNRFVWPRRIVRTGAWVAIFLALAVAAYAGWRLWQMLIV